MYVSTAESRKGFPVLDLPRVGRHFTHAHEPELGRVRVHITPFSVQWERGTWDCTLPTLTSQPYRVRVHITPFSVQRERGALHITNAHKARWTGLGSILRRTRCRGRWLHLTKIIFDTHRSPHIGSKLCCVRATRGVG